MPVGGYCYSGDVGECFYENKLKEVEVSAVAGAEPAPQLEPRQDGGQSGGSGGLTLAGLESGRSTWPGQAMLLGQKAFLAREPGRETENRGGKEGVGWGCDEVASPVNSWSQGHKVSDALCVHKR